MLECETQSRKTTLLRCLSTGGYIINKICLRDCLFIFFLQWKLFDWMVQFLD